MANIQGPNTYGGYINQAFKDPRYLEAEAEVARAQQALDALVTSAPTFQTEEQKRILAADKFLPTFNADRAKQVAALYSRPATARAEYQDIFDPTKRSALVAQAVGNVLGQLSGTNELISQRKGTATDLAQQAYNSLLARIEGQRSTLETAREKRNILRGLLEDAAKAFYDEQRYEKERADRRADQPGPGPTKWERYATYDGDGNQSGFALDDGLGNIVYTDMEGNQKTDISDVKRTASVNFQPNNNSPFGDLNDLINSYGN